MKTFVKLATAAATVVACTGAMAATAPVNGTSVNSITFAGGVAIADTWTFTLPTLSTFDGLVSSTYSGPAANAIQNFAATLTGPGSYSQSWTYQSLAPAARVQLLFSGANLVAGSYILAVSGTAGAAGSKYTVELNAAPVPEPHEWAMMLAGLGLVGFVASRKRRQEGAPLGVAA